jgi:hypothetical protein
LQEQRKVRRDQAKAETGDEPEDDPSALLTLGTAMSPRKNVVVDSRKEVPSHFFDEGFDLSLASTFYKCFYDGTPHKELANKIDSYLELVERDLTDKLNKRSDAFFRALRDLQSLHLTVASSYRTMEVLKENLGTADEELVVKSLDIVSKKTKRANYTKIQRLLRLLQAVSRSIPGIEALIEKEDFFGALETIRAAENAMKNELRGAASLGGFQTKLDRFNKIIRGHLSAQFVGLATGSDVLLDDAVQKIRPLVVEMQSIGQLISTLETYSEIQHQNIKRITSECFTPEEDSIHASADFSAAFPISIPGSPSSSSSETSQQSSIGLSSPIFNDSEERNMRIYETAAANMKQEDFLPKLQGLLDELLSTIIRLKEVHQLIDQVFKDLDEKEKRNIALMKSDLVKIESGDALKTSKPPAQPSNGDHNGADASSDEEDDDSGDLIAVTRADIAKLEEENQLQKRLRTQISFDSSEMVYVSAELSNTLIARLLRARSAEHLTMPVQAFSSLYNAVQHFIVHVDKNVGRPCPTLRVILNGQAKAMFNAWDTKMCAKLSATLDVERWMRAEIANDFVAVIMCLYTPKQNIHHKEVPEGAENVKTLTLGSERFSFVNSELIFLDMLYDYLVFLDTMPTMYPEVISKIAEAINLWSKLTYGLVLKQGAVENQVVQGNINIGHLSLASNCLGVQLALIPKIKERVISYIHDPSEISVLSNLDRATEECTTHQQEIYSKMISTMRSRVDTCFKVYKVDEATDKITPSVEKLVDATKKMHKILKTYLSPTPFKAIFRQIISVYNAQIKAHITALNIKTPKEKAKLLTDVHFILTGLRSLEGVDDPSDELAEFVHERFKA